MKLIKHHQSFTSFKNPIQSDLEAIVPSFQHLLYLLSIKKPLFFYKAFPNPNKENPLRFRGGGFTLE